MFKNLKNGNVVFALVTTDPITLYNAKVINVSPMRFETIQNRPQQVIDVTLDIDGKQNTYVIMENASTSYTSDMVIACSRDDIVRELEAMENQSDEFINSHEYHVRRKKQITLIKEDIFPEKKEEKLRDERLNNLEGKIDAIMEILKKKGEKS